MGAAPSGQLSWGGQSCRTRLDEPQNFYAAFQGTYRYNGEQMAEWTTARIGTAPAGDYGSSDREHRFLGGLWQRTFVAAALCGKSEHVAFSVPTRVPRIGSLITGTESHHPCSESSSFLTILLAIRVVYAEVLGYRGHFAIAGPDPVAPQTA
jgi:hypothetical protein